MNMDKASFGKRVRARGSLGQEHQAWSDAAPFGLPIIRRRRAFGRLDPHVDDAIKGADEARAL